MNRSSAPLLTTEQRTELAAFHAGEDTESGALSPVVLRALEDEYRSMRTATTSAAPQDFAARRKDDGRDLVTAMEAAASLGISLTAFARSVEPRLEKIRSGSGATRFRRSDLRLAGAERDRAQRARRSGST